MNAHTLWWFSTVGLLLASSPLQAVPVHQWSQRFGGGFDEGGNSVATDESNNIVVTGYYVVAEDSRRGLLMSAGGQYLTQAFLMKFGTNGNQLWSKTFGHGQFGISIGHSVATDGSGNVFITGYLSGTADFGGGTLASEGSSDIFVAAFDDTGNHLWSKRFGDANMQVGLSVAADGSGDIIVTGYFHGTADFGGGLLTSAGAADIFVAKFDSNGNHLWSRRFGDGDDQSARSIAAEGSGDIVVTGHFNGTTDFGGGPLTSAGGYDIFLAKFDSDGNHLWSRSFGDADSQFGVSVVRDGFGNIIVTGYFNGTTDFGGGPLTSAGGYDVFVARLDPHGNHLWSRSFGDGDSQFGASIAADNLGDIIVTGRFRGTTDFGGGPLASAGEYDIFVAKIDANGTHVWSQSFGDGNIQSGRAVAADGSGGIVVTGEFLGTVDFGDGTLSSARADWYDIFVAKFMEPANAVLITRFDAATREGAIEIRWDVWSDEALESFALYRSDDARPQAVVVAEGPFDSATRSFVDTKVNPGRTYHYELVIHAQSGDDVRSPVVTVTMPRLEATLGQNFPNPFNPATAIEYTLSAPSRAALVIYDTAGRLVVRLDQGVREAGTHRIEWNARDAYGHAVGSGVYFYRLEGTPRVGPRKMVLVR